MSVRNIEEVPTTTAAPVKEANRKLGIITNIFSKKRKLEKFYERQESFLRDTEEDRTLVKEFEENHLRHRRYNYVPETDSPSLLPNRNPPLPVPTDEHKERRRDTILAQMSVVVNLALLIALIVIFVRSTSMAILATAVDCAADLTSGIVIWVAARLIRRRDSVKYPRGRTRLEPLAIVIVAVVMAVVNLEVSVLGVF